jgi:hypothetical protein
MVGIFMSMEANKPNPYLDDIFHGKGYNFDSHLSILNEIFQRLKEAGIFKPFHARFDNQPVMVESQWANLASESSSCG